MDDISILIVEDESLIAHDIATLVERFGFGVSKLCTQGDKVISYIKEGNEPSLILMDINLGSHPNGIETAREIKKLKDIPIIYLTAYVDDDTMQKAMDTNPSSYLTKPFGALELHAAIKIALKKNKKDANAPIQGDIIFDDEFSFDIEGLQLICNGEFVNLTKQETELLMLLISRKNQIVPFDIMELEIWPDKEANENTRRALVSRLRNKMQNKHIDTIIGMGYRLQF